jgi:hypothetical protein
MAVKKTLILRSCVRDKAFYLVFSLVPDRFDPVDFWLLACFLLDQFRSARGAAGLRYAGEEIRAEIDLLMPIVRREQHDVLQTIREELRK